MISASKMGNTLDAANKANREKRAVIPDGKRERSDRRWVPPPGTTGWRSILRFSLSIMWSAVTVRKIETDHGESEWKASRTRMGKVFTVSLGPSHAIDLSNLQAAARRLAGKHAPIGSTTGSTARHDASTLTLSLQPLLALFTP